EQNLKKLEKCSTADSKIGPRDLESRQKMGEMSDLCLPSTPNSARAASKVEQNLKKLEKCSTADSKIGPRDLESRTKSQKIGKMFYHRLQIRPARI
ncbi:hypothetical protein, partial [uncultured Ligilactobacillus sp.]|uniref:hypothetical protein n=1 Tax=uncultured Ligilactobacillus sp. TaxID=2837633 RepID=UPI00259B6DCF